MKRKIGIMGGTFNPIHNGHIAVAKAAMEQFRLNEILFITGGNPPHKKNNGILPTFARHKMVCLAISDIAGFKPCDYEVNKKTYSYSLETIQFLKNEYVNADFFFIIGADSFHNLPTWHKPEELLELCTLLVYNREGYDINSDCNEITKTYSNCRVDFIKSENIDISSSNIRNDIKKGNDVVKLLPERVYEYINRNKLYTPKENDLKKAMKKCLNKERYVHSLGVCNTAVEMAKLYNVSTKKAYVAGILHDCAKNIAKSKALQKCLDYDVELDEFELINRALIHAKLGEKVAAAEYGITDEDVLTAIKWHTLGRPGMTTLEKIIYVADVVEPSRSFEGIDSLRKIAFSNLDKAVIECTKTTIKFNQDKGKAVHPNAFEVIKYLEDNNKDKKR